MSDNARSHAPAHLVPADRRRLRTWLLGAALVAAAPIVGAQDKYPTKPIRIVVPWAAGTPPDVAARVVAAPLQQALGQTVLVENRPGASGTIGLGEVARSPADGYTLGALHYATATVISLYPQAKLDLNKDFIGIGQMEWGHNVLVVSPSLGVDTVAALVEFVKKNPASFASSGVGTPAHLTGLVFQRSTDTQAAHVPYNNFGQAIADVATGRVTYMLLAAPAAVPQVLGGKLKALAVTGPARNPSLPAVPTVAEAKLPAVQSRTWSGLIARADTPRGVVELLARELARVTAMPEVREQLAKLQGEAPSESLAQFRELIRRDAEQGVKFVRDNGIKAD